MLLEHPIWLKLFLFLLRDVTHPSHWRMMVQEAGFEPANRYGLGPHPSAFDQAGRLLRQVRLSPRVYQHRDRTGTVIP